ncbi:MAG TPA: hypothetical protein VHL14_10240 [Steroidobacteraceae bacterium]|nr:hypothetical protein [Steroidobacteraceae bacterium]
MTRALNGQSNTWKQNIATEWCRGKEIPHYHCTLLLICAHLLCVLRVGLMDCERGHRANPQL